MQTNLEGRVVVVTGAGSGIGLATVEGFLAEGARVLAADLDPSALEGRDNVVTCQADLLQAGAGDAVIDAALEAFGTLNVVVNTVGGGQPQPDRILHATDEEWMRSFDLNVLSMVRVCRAALPHLIEAGGGAIVSVASDEGVQPDPLFPDYAAGKAAVTSLSKSISKAYGAQGIRSNVVSPGFTKTPMTEGFVRGLAADMGISVDEAHAHITDNIKRIPLRRLGEPSDVANVIVFLASDLAVQVTGSNYRVDGGTVATT